MMYDDFPILSNNDYLKLSEEYNSNKHLENNDLVSILFQSINNCLNSLYLSNFTLNAKIKTELNSHKQVLTKLKSNLALLFSTPQNETKQFIDFNIFNYLSNLTNIQNILNDCLKIDKKNKYFNLILNSKYEINNLIISLLNILSNLNIKIFNHM